MGSKYFVKCDKGHVFGAKPGSALEKKCRQEYPEELMIDKVLISPENCPRCNLGEKNEFANQLAELY
ncbi:MAG: hypothetical protein Q8P74_00790 [bacterium]|nr:hypothetical protein [bacterium]